MSVKQDAKRTKEGVVIFKIKRILAVMLVFCMMMGVMPNMLMTAHAAENYLTKAPENITLAPGESKGVSVTFAHRVIGEADWGNANISGRENGLDRVINFGANAGTEVTPYTFVYDAEKAGTTETYWLMYTCTDANGNHFPGEKVSFTVTYLEEAPAPATTSVTVVKEWDDNDSENRPDSVMVVLKADGEECGEPVTLNEENNWTCTWTELPVATEDGTPIVYTVDEVDVEGYEKTITDAEVPAGIGFTITNTLIEEEPEIPETVTVAGTKTWVGDEEADRPESIIVNLLANGEVIGEAEVTARTQWTFYFGELPKYNEDGAEIEYSVEEEAVEGYTATYDGYDITNTLKEEAPENPVYGITVINGKSYTGAGVEITAAEEGTKITIKGDAAPEGKEFDKWVVDYGTITLADATKAETTFDMPAERVQVTATYKDKVVTPPADDDNDDNKDDVNKPSDDDKEDESKPSDTNKPATDTESPKTGDTSNIFMWFAVLFVSGFALVGFLLFGKRRRA